jgi:DNA replication and repair protein RecF
VRGWFELPGGVREVAVAIAEGKRAARVDGKPVRDPDELFGGLAVVAFTPDDLSLVKGGPEGRRRLLDRAVQNRHPAHLADARDYLRALRSRNQLLRQGAPAPLQESFEEPLARIGARLRLRREQLLDEMRDHAARAFAEVARGESPLHLGYLAAGRDSDGLGPEASLRGEGELEAALLAALRRRLPRDRERGYTSVGPHADDVALSLGDRPARLFASQGQARAVVLAFKIGEIENLRRLQGRAPLLLLDDVSSELDPRRNEYLMRYLAELQGQVVLTTTDPRLVQVATLPKSGVAEAVFHTVRSGRIEKGFPS